MAPLEVTPIVRLARGRRRQCGLVVSFLVSVALVGTVPGVAGASVLTAQPSWLDGPSVSTTIGYTDVIDTDGELSPVQGAEAGEQRVRVLPFAGTIALTFDDGPNERTTMPLLDVLDELHIKVTFFVMGWRVERWPEIVREAAARGHSVQVHAFQHLPLTGESNEAIVRDIQRTAQAIYDATGVWPTCVRPPYGATSDRVNQVLTGLGYRVILWDFDSADAETQSASVVRSRIPRWAAGQDILAHDTIPLWRTVISTAVEQMRERNIGFSTICQPFAVHLTAYPAE